MTKNGLYLPISHYSAHCRQTMCPKGVEKAEIPFRGKFLLQNRCRQTAMKLLEPFLLETKTHEILK